MNKQTLLKKMKQAYASTDIHEIKELYIAILDDFDALNEHFTENEIADIYFNCSLNYIELAKTCASLENYDQALQMVRIAQSDMKNAQIRYSSEEDIQATEHWMASYRQLQSSYRKCLLDLHLGQDYQQIIETKFKRPRSPVNDFFPAPKKAGVLNVQSVSPISEDEEPSSPLAGAVAL